jgi:hypothetical protein
MSALQVLLAIDHVPARPADETTWRASGHARRLILGAVLCLALADFTGAQSTTAPLSASTVSQIDRAVTAPPAIGTRRAR